MRPIAYLSSLCLFSLCLTPKICAETITWKQSVDEAAKNNSAIKSALQSYEASTSNIRQAKAAFYPDVSASFDATYGRNMSIFESKATDSYAATLSVSENIFNGWADQAQIDQSEAEAQIANADLTLTKAQTSADLKTAYANLVYAQRAIRLQESIRSRRLSNLRLVELRFDNGSENKGSVLLSKAYLDQADFNIIQAKNSIQTASAQLARAMGRDESTTIQAAEDIPTLAVPESPDFQALAIATPQRAQALLRERTAETNITLARSGYFPTFGVTGSYGRRDDEFFPRDDSWSVGLVLNVPIFNGGRDYYAIQSAISSRSAAGSTREDLDRQLVANLTSARARLLEARKNLEVTASFLKASEMRAEIGRGRYNNGLLSFEDWDLIESDLIQRQQAHILSQRDYVVAEATWENALGTGSIK